MKLASSKFVPLSATVALFLISVTPQVMAQPPRTALEQLALKKFPDITKTELRIVQTAETGDLALGGTSSDFNDPTNDPDKAIRYHWRERRSVRGELIRWLCNDEQVQKLLDPHGIRVIGFWVVGEIDLSYLTVKVPLILSRCRIPDGIKLDFADVRALSLVGSWVGKKEAVLSSKEQIALSGRGSMVRGDILLSDGFRSFGEVDLYGAKIDGQLYCVGGSFSNPGQRTLSLRLASVGGEAALRKGFESDGIVDLVGAKIGGDLLADEAIFGSAESNGVKARGLTVARAFYWAKVRISTNTKLDLSYASVGILVDDEKSWPAPGNLILNGFVYADIRGPASDLADRLLWLERQPPPFKPQPYAQLAKVFRENGQEADAKEVLIAKEADAKEVLIAKEAGREDAHRRVQHFGDLFLAQMVRFSHATLWLTADYGYKPLRALWWIAAFVVMGAGAFRWGYGAGIVIPTDHEAYETFSKTRSPPPDYQSFNSFVYSLETFIPLIELHQANYWLPNPQSNGKSRVKDSGRLLRLYLWTHILLGWMFTTMLVAGLAGLVKTG